MGMLLKFFRLWVLEHLVSTVISTRYVVYGLWGK